MIGLLIFLIGLAANQAMAAVGTVQDMVGNAGTETGKLGPGSALENGMTVRTGSKSWINMKFEDGQTVILGEKTTFRINEYRYIKAKPEEDSIALSLLKGSMRVMTGLIGKVYPQAFKLETETATLGIRGTDFMAATGSLYLQVLDGTVSVANSTGTALFSAGQIGFAASLTAAPTAITAAQLPAAVSASFSQLSSLTFGAATGAAGSSGAGAATSAATSATGAAGITTGAIATGAGIVAGVAAAISNTSPSSGTTGTTGTK